ncbi:MAG: hypothetical protein JXM69_08725 [Anaerolineae bacterium]|nr:hypothetical protein [Anaerolineae bacterium]
MFSPSSPPWKRLLIGILLTDLLIIAGLFYFFTATSLATIPTPLPPTAVALGPTPTATIEPWAGPPPQPSPTATRFLGPSTPIPTNVLAASGFPPGFTPTPRPTREPIYISLPQIFPVSGGSVDVPVVNQILYPEPFFAPGTNSACGPVALYAAAYGLGVGVDYGRLRNIAVSHGFGSAGISRWGMVNTIVTLNHELGSPLTIESGDHYSLKDLIRHLRQQSVVVVLVYVRKENGQYRLTTDEPGAVGHFLLVERINTQTKRVTFAGSTLGMAEVSLRDFIQSWTNNPQALSSSGNEHAQSWALILKRNP